MKPQKLTELKEAIEGAVATEGKVYDKASEMFMRTVSPSVVVRPAHAQDVAQAVLFAKENKVKLAIRSGGHHSTAARLPDGVLLLDMRGIARVEVLDENEGLVCVGAGALWGNVAAELEKYELGISSGDTASVGVGGLSTGAGIGWMVRKYGIVLDNTVEIELVTADGQVVTASSTENPDLFWAVRGGGSNFGVVTRFTFKAHPVRGIYAGMVQYPLEDITSILKGWRDAMRQAPAELSTILTIMPTMGDNPASIMIQTCFDGTDKTAAEAAHKPLFELGAPTHQSLDTQPYGAMLGEAKLPPGIRVVGNTTFMKEFSDEAIAAITKVCETTVPILQIRHIGGAMNRVPLDESAFAFRNSEIFIVSPAFVAPDASAEDIAKATAYWQTIKQFGHGRYLNLETEATGKEVAEAYPDDVLTRLQNLKSQYDPENVFNANYNITPIA